MWLKNSIITNKPVVIVVVMVKNMWILPLTTNGKVTTPLCPAGSFDVVIIVGALSDGQVPACIAKELCKATKPGETYDAPQTTLIKPGLQKTRDSILRPLSPRRPRLYDHQKQPGQRALQSVFGAAAEAHGGRRSVELCDRHGGGGVGESRVSSWGGLHRRLCLPIQGLWCTAMQPHALRNEVCGNRSQSLHIRSAELGRIPADTYRNSWRHHKSVSAQPYGS